MTQYRIKTRITQIAQKIKQVQLFPGAHNALASSATYVHSTAFIHGGDGLADVDEIPRKVSKAAETDMTAPVAIIDIVRKNPGNIYIKLNYNINVK